MFYKLKDKVPHDRKSIEGIILERGKWSKCDKEVDFGIFSELVDSFDGDNPPEVVETPIPQKEERTVAKNKVKSPKKKAKERGKEPTEDKEENVKDEIEEELTIEEDKDKDKEEKDASE